MPETGHRSNKIEVTPDHVNSRNSKLDYIIEAEVKKQK